MREILVVWALVTASLTSIAMAAEPECEKRIRDTGMIMLQNDPQTICKQRPSRETQDCLVEVLTRAKGKLRNADLFEVYGVCKADARPNVRACLIQGMNKPWNDTGYRPAKKVGSECLLRRKEILRKKTTRSR